MLLKKALATLEFDLIKNKLLDLSSCDVAKDYIKNLEPIYNITEIERLLTETDDAVNFIIKRGQPPLSGVKNIKGAVRRAVSGGALSFTELLNVSGLLRAARRIVNYASSVKSTNEDTISEYISQIIENRPFEEKISRCIISEDEMADEASHELYTIRKQIVSAQNNIKDRLNEILKSTKFSKYIQESVVTMRSDRYCIPVKTEYRGEINGIVHDTSSSGQTLFIEPAFVVEANNKIRELRVKETHEIAKIVDELSREVGENESILLSDLQIISYLDFTFAKARLALDQKAVKPILNTVGKISLTNARHPLIPKEKVVPISVYLAEKECMLITGPNTGGKTVALKTVGLLTVMMQSGLLVPAKERSELCVYDGIFADIGDEQSISQSLSTFSAHMKTVISILNVCDNRSLILLDELGAGTDPTEGAALAMSILEFMHLMGSSVLATTHYSELKVFASTTPGFVNAACKFDTETLKPTYKLLIGVPGKSNAFAISNKLGLDSNIIERAKEFLTNEDLRFEDMLKGIEESKKKIDTESEQIEALKKESAALKEEIAREKEAFIEQKNELINKTKEEARTILNKARNASDKLLSEIRKAASLKEAEKAVQEFRKVSDETDEELYKSYQHKVDNTKPPKTLKAGETVRIVSLNNKATVLKEPDKDGQVYVQAGIMKLYVPLSDLRLEKDIAENGVKKKLDSSAAIIKAATIKSELDVRGMTVDEAVIIIDRQIHDGFIAKQSQFSVIHGKGTGALRAGIHDFLRTCKQVKSYRLGTFGEGDAGVTIVTLR
ncbi:MAG: endonuclease MutS2 [Ruminococcaceae bacterium]|nr:endonuclease MutS2 [Oscillospiraceae bacterium]